MLQIPHRSDRHTPFDSALRRSAALVTLTLAALIATGTVLAAEAPNAEKDESTSQPAESGKQDGDTEPAEVFIPTEEISEDFAVAFPVDI